MTESVTTHGRDLYCNECGALCNSDDPNNDTFLEDYITTTCVNTGEVKHYCVMNDEACFKNRTKKNKQEREI